MTSTIQDRRRQQGSGTHDVDAGMAAQTVRGHRVETTKTGAAGEDLRARRALWQTPGTKMWHREGCFVHPVTIGATISDNACRITRLDAPTRPDEDVATSTCLYATELEAIEAALALAEAHVSCLRRAKNKLTWKGVSLP